MIIASTLEELLTKGTYKIVDNDLPTLINLYNQGMGSIDLFDKMRSVIVHEFDPKCRTDLVLGLVSMDILSICGSSIYSVYVSWCHYGKLV